MSRRPNIEPTSKINLVLKSSDKVWLDIFLSDLNGNKPYAAYQQFFTDRLNEFRRRIARHRAQERAGDRDAVGA